MDIPVITDFDNYPFHYVNNYIKNITLSNQAIYIDLLPYFSQYGADKLIVSIMDAHMNEFGHKVTADVLFNKIKSENLIKNVQK